jgi:alkylation response protein AidB-like acyl-CoA dehydrogenase
VDLKFNEQQKLLKRNARGFMEKEIVPLADEYDKRCNPFSKEQLTELYLRLIPLGYATGLIPQEYGGGGLDYLSFGIIVEELARASGSLGICEMGTQIMGPLTLYAEGTEELKAKYLKPTIAGEKVAIGCLGVTEPDVGTAARDIKTVATSSGKDYIINGTKTWISNGGYCDVAVVLAVADDSKGHRGIARFLVEKERSKFEIRELHKLGFRSSSTAELIFQDCHVPKENLAGEIGQGYGGAVENLFPLLRATLATIGVGLAQAAIDTSVRYAREGKQFGRPIGKFQLVQEMLADMVIETEAARLLALQAFDSIQKGQQRVKKCAIAKAFAPEVAVRTTSKAIEIHGAYGVSEEYTLERYFRDARTLVIPDGTSEIQKLIVGREVLGMSAFV